jgi:hypothetical protein
VCDADPAIVDVAAGRRAACHAPFQGPWARGAADDPGPEADRSVAYGTR